MERFAFKIDKALKANLYKICRLCGIDNPDKVTILTQVVDVDGEPELAVKIEQLVGLTIMQNDKMPQEMCSLCVDKINDFYEFREMCLTTNIQTRKLLGLKNVEPKKETDDIKPEIIVKEEYTGKRRGRKRKSEVEYSMLSESSFKKMHQTTDVHMAATQRRRQQLHDIHTKLQELQVKPKKDIKTEPEDFYQSTKYKVRCPICSQGFCSNLKMEKHRSVVHLPCVHRYMCVACNETIKKAVDIKNHQLWHKLTKTPYRCGACDHSARTLYQYSRHLREHCQNLPVTVLDRICPQCGDAFATNFLYNTHNCASATLTCAGCDLVLGSENAYLLHAAKCPKSYETHSHHIPDAGLGLSADCNVRIKNEAEMEGGKEHPLDVKYNINMSSGVLHDRMPQLPNGGVVSIPCDNTHASKPPKGNKLKHNLKRIDELIQSTMSTLASIKQEPNQNEYDNTEEDIMENGQNASFDSEQGDNFQDSDDGQSNSDNSITDECLEVQLHIKEERQDDEPNVMNNVHDNTTEKIPVLKLKIKKEHGSLSSSLVDDSVCSDTKRKKKKQREANTGHHGIGQHFEHEDNQIINPANIVVKQERIEESEIEQLQISSISSGIQFGDKHVIERSNQEIDVKPNKADLDRLIAIGNKHVVAPQFSGAHMPRITAVQGGCDVNNFNGNQQQLCMTNVRIKSEPLDEHDLDNQMMEKQCSMSTFNIKTEPDDERQAIQLDHQQQAFDESHQQCATNSMFSIAKEKSVAHQERMSKTGETDQLQHPTCAIITSVHCEVDATPSNDVPSEGMERNQQDVALHTIPDNAKEIDSTELNVATSKCDLDNECNEIIDQSSTCSEKNDASISTALSTMSMVVGETKEHELQAQPFYDSTSIVSSIDSLNSNSDLNVTVELAEEVTENTLQQTTSEQATTSSVAAEDVCHSSQQLNECNVSASSSSVSPVRLSAPPTEETDNLHNERQLERMQTQQQFQHIRSLVIDDSNVNEIAENNNNANIERELRDESSLRACTDVDVIANSSMT